MIGIVGLITRMLVQLQTRCSISQVFSHSLKELCFVVVVIHTTCHACQRQLDLGDLVAFVASWKNYLLPRERLVVLKS